MHHGVVHVSDITSADGRKLNEEFLAHLKPCFMVDHYLMVKSPFGVS